MWNDCAQHPRAGPVGILCAHCASRSSDTEAPGRADCDHEGTPSDRHCRRRPGWPGHPRRPAAQAHPAAQLPGGGPPALPPGARRPGACASTSSRATTRNGPSPATSAPDLRLEQAREQLRGLRHRQRHRAPRGAMSSSSTAPSPMSRRPPASPTGTTTKASSCPRPRVLGGPRGRRSAFRPSRSSTSPP